MRVKLDRPFEIRDRRVAIRRIERSEDEAGESIAAAEIFFPRFSVLGRTTAEFLSLDI